MTCFLSPRFVRSVLPVVTGGVLLATVAAAQEPTPAPPLPAAASATAPAPAFTTTPAPLAAPASVPETVTFLPGGPASPISAGVTVPAGQALLFTSGTVPPVLDDKAPAGSRERYGDTKTQGTGALKQIEAQLRKAGLGLQDVIYLRVYVAADKAKEGRFDFPGWFEAYGLFFGTPENPVKPARSTVGVAGLVNPDWLIEIEAVAAYPNKGSAPTAK